MDDMNGGASAPAETNAVAAQEPVQTPNPINTDPKTVEAKPETKAEKPSAREALKAAAAKVADKEKADDAAKPAPVQSQPKQGDKPADRTLPEPKPAKGAETTATKSGEPVRTEADRKPVATQTGHHEPPARFKSDAAATAEWERAPEAVKAAVHRTVRELEAGIEKHRASAEEFEKVRDFDDLAKRNNTSLRDAMTRYTNFEKALLSDPMKGLNMVCDYIGVPLRTVAAHIMGQQPDQVQGQNDATIRELRQEIAMLKQSVGGVTSTMQQQHVAGVEAQVDRFKAENPRFEELAEDIAFFLKSGKTKDLAEAYQLAERLNPAPAATAPAAPQTRIAPDLEAQTRKGSKSITGAPSAGSDPATKRASTSIKDSLRRALAQAG
ncbi:hypothetical protein FJ930_19725 [Mesorhizobium sp. B2-4-15]|uniref:hypothetical protein n=1 Tax=Mesorhizobium sp. B2-4-15 TaxID=2589934 RepID=UPI00114E64DD|nr:hypothetical protein [Mesorhizobium sp. B2-4-15]TPK70199.1 hypothetical protein FJ930_19725 [Mesorhizobium sp. B2-4-15]